MQRFGLKVLVNAGLELITHEVEFQGNANLGEEALDICKNGLVLRDSDTGAVVAYPAHRIHQVESL